MQEKYFGHGDILQRAMLVILMMITLGGILFSNHNKWMKIEKNGVTYQSKTIFTTQPVLIKNLNISDKISTIEYTGELQIIYFTSEKGYQMLSQGHNTIDGTLKLFFASTFWTKLQNIFGHCCMSKLDKVAKRWPVVLRLAI